MSATEARAMTEADILCEVRQLVGGDMERIAQATRILQRDSEVSASKRVEAVELACELEEMRERIKVAHALLESSIASLDEICDLSGYIKSPIDRALEARNASRTTAAPRASGAGL